MTQPAAAAAAPSRRPFITANQVTVARMVLLPLPCAMVLYGSVPQQWVALVIYTLMGITDWVDGYLARKYGPTVLGGLLDPVADKVFIAAVLMPLSFFKLAHPAVIMAILFREFLITSLRSVMSLQGTAVKTSVLAKLKTAIQMAGAGFIFIIYRMPDDTDARVTLGMFAAGAVLFMAWRWRAAGKLNPLVSVPCAMIVLSFLVRLALDADDAVTVHWGVILVFTWASALDYLSGAAGVLKRGSAVQGLGRLLWSVVAGLGLPYVMVHLPEVTPVWVLLLGAELTSGAVDNLRCHEGEVPKPWSYPLRALVLAAGTVGILALPSDGRMGSPAFLGALGLAFGMSLWTSLDFYMARRIIWGDQAVAPQSVQGSVGR
ncbi:MAG: CDP-alcohol phosphatidyltransferase family protein [Deltaproteobacteria bacterium]|nr:CDP-alcohol phosphatidyltransferase family protein [Deltaproteobacteria bacterium]